MSKSQTFTGLRTAHGPLSAFRSAMKEGVAEYTLAVLELSEKLLLTFLPFVGQNSWVPAGPVLKVIPHRSGTGFLGSISLLCIFFIAQCGPCHS